MGECRGQQQSSQRRDMELERHRILDTARGSHRCLDGDGALIVHISRLVEGKHGTNPQPRQTHKLIHEITCINRTDRPTHTGQEGTHHRPGRLFNSKLHGGIQALDPVLIGLHHQSIRLIQHEVADVLREEVIREDDIREEVIRGEKR